MKNLNDCLNENMIREASGSLVMCFDHNNPEFTCIIAGCTAKDIDKLRWSSFDCITTSKLSKGLVMIQHNDESGSIDPIKYKNEQQMIKYCWDQFQANKEYIDEDGMLEDLDLEDIGLYLSFYDMDKVKNNRDMWKKVTDFIENSEVDGDSASAYAIIDLNKMEEVVSGKINLAFYDSYKSFQEDIFPEEKENRI